MCKAVRGVTEATVTPTDSASDWYFVSHIDSFVNRNDGACGCFFDSINNRARFDPIASERGIPSGVSLTFRERYDSDKEHVFSGSYVSLTEICKVDWSERPRQGLKSGTAPTTAIPGGASNINQTLSDTERS